MPDHYDKGLITEPSRGYNEFLTMLEQFGTGSLDPSVTSTPMLDAQEAPLDTNGDQIYTTATTANGAESQAPGFQFSMGSGFGQGLQDPLGPGQGRMAFQGKAGFIGEDGSFSHRSPQIGTGGGGVGIPGGINIGGGDDNDGGILGDIAGNPLASALTLGGLRLALKQLGGDDGLINQLFDSIFGNNPDLLPTGWDGPAAGDFGGVDPFGGGTDTDPGGLPDPPPTPPANPDLYDGIFPGSDTPVDPNAVDPFGNLDFGPGNVDPNAVDPFGNLDFGTGGVDPNAVDPFGNLNFGTGGVDPSYADPFGNLDFGGAGDGVITGGEGTGDLPGSSLGDAIFGTGGGLTANPALGLLLDKFGFASWGEALASGGIEQVTGILGTGGLGGPGAAGGLIGAGGLLIPLAVGMFINGLLADKPTVGPSFGTTFKTDGSIAGSGSDNQSGTVIRFQPIFNEDVGNFLRDFTAEFGTGVQGNLTGHVGYAPASYFKSQVNPQGEGSFFYTPDGQNYLFGESAVDVVGALLEHNVQVGKLNATAEDILTALGESNILDLDTILAKSEEMDKYALGAGGSPSYGGEGQVSDYSTDTAALERLLTALENNLDPRLDVHLSPLRQAITASQERDSLLEQIPVQTSYREGSLYDNTNQYTNQELQNLVNYGEPSGNIGLR